MQNKTQLKKITCYKINIVLTGCQLIDTSKKTKLTL